MKINRDKLEYLAEMRGLNNQELAYKAAISPPLLSRIKARGSCNYATAKRLACVIGWDFIERPTHKANPEDVARWQQQYEESTADLKQEMEAEAVQAARSTAVDTPGEYESIILDFINKPVPTHWNRWPITSRQIFWRGDGLDHQHLRLVSRDRVCAAEVWCEAFECVLHHMSNKDAKRINDIIASAPGWRRAATTVRFGPYGTRRGFVREQQT